MWCLQIREGEGNLLSHCGEDEDGGLEDDNVDNDQDDENGDFEDD